MFGKSRSLSVALFVVLGICCVFSGCCCKKGPGEITITPPQKQEPEKKMEPTPAPEPPKPGRVDETLIKVPDENLKMIHFDYDKYTIRDDAAVILKRDAEWIKNNLDKGEFVQIEIDGHCDERGTNKYNMVLGERRANAARNFLINEGVPASILVTVSYGEEFPLDPRSNEEAWAKNRRCELMKLILAKQ